MKNSFPDTDKAWGIDVEGYEPKRTDNEKGDELSANFDPKLKGMEKFTAYRFTYESLSEGSVSIIGIAASPDPDRIVFVFPEAFKSGEYFLVSDNPDEPRSMFLFNNTIMRPTAGHIKIKRTDKGKFVSATFKAMVEGSTVNGTFQMNWTGK